MADYYVQTERTLLILIMICSGQRLSIQTLAVK